MANSPDIKHAWIKRSSHAPATTAMKPPSHSAPAMPSDEKGLPAVTAPKHQVASVSSKAAKLYGSAKKVVRDGR